MTTCTPAALCMVHLIEFRIQAASTLTLNVHSLCR